MATKGSVHKRPLDGAPVFDATDSLTIEVNKNDIARADQKEPADCAMARAVRRELHCHEVRAHLAHVYVRQRENGPWTKYETTNALRNEIIAFDRQGEFQPGEYVLRAIRPGNRVGVRGKNKDGANRNTKRSRQGVAVKKRRSKPHMVANVRGGPVL